MAYTDQKSVSHRSGVWDVQDQDPGRFSVVAGEGLLPVRRCGFLTLSSSYGGRGDRSLWGLFYKALILLLRASPSEFKHLPKAHLLIQSCLGIKISAYEFWWDTNIQTLALVLGNSLSQCFSVLVLLKSEAR